VAGAGVVLLRDWPNGAVRAAMRGDKKRSAGRPRLVLLDGIGRPAWGVDPGDDLLDRAVERAVTGV